MFSEGNHETVGDKSEIGIKRRAGWSQGKNLLTSVILFNTIGIVYIYE